jgi:hypothetical protein
MILQGITKSENRVQLESEMELLFSNPITQRYFNYGFGSNHMWLKQKSLRRPNYDEVMVNPDERILIVKF